MRCLRCNRNLTTSLAISRRYGTTCWKKAQQEDALVSAGAEVSAGIEIIEFGDLEGISGVENIKFGDYTTVEGTSGMLRITNQLRGDDFEDYLNFFMVTEYENSVIYEAMDLRSEWGADSNTPISRALEKYIAELFNLEHEHYQPVAFKIPELSSIQKEAAKAIYDTTQRLLNAKSVKNIILYRGIGWNNTQGRPTWASQEIGVGDRIILQGRTLSSWTFDREIAQTYIQKYDNGFLLKTNVPSDRIFAIIDVDADQESVCIYNTDAEVISIVDKGKGEVSR